MREGRIAADSVYERLSPTSYKGVSGNEVLSRGVVKTNDAWLENMIRDQNVELVSGDAPSSKFTSTARRDLRRLLVEEGLAPKECLEGLEPPSASEVHEQLLRALNEAWTGDPDPPRVTTCLLREGRWRACIVRPSGPGAGLMHEWSSPEFSTAVRGVANVWLGRRRGDPQAGGPEEQRLREMLDAP